MNKTAIINKLTGIASRASLKVKKHSPEIMLGAGIVGVVTSGVMACKATLKVNEILEEAKEQVDAVHNVLENPKNEDKYSEEDGKKALAITYARTGLKLGKLYGPAVTLGAASIACIVGSHKIMTKRNAAITAAYMSVHRSFKDYRGRVIERFGEELDKELRFNIKSAEVETTEVDKKGNEKTVTHTVNVVDPNTYSEYARVYDDGCPGWDKDAEWNLTFLKQQQSYANDKLKIKKHLFLNEVYDMLGFPRTKAGQCVGWVYDEEHPVGDNFVDFGIYNINNPKACDFVNGYERSIVLDFNVDGPILDLI